MFRTALGLFSFYSLALSISDMIVLVYLLIMFYINVFCFYYYPIGACLFSNEGQKRVDLDWQRCGKVLSGVNRARTLFRICYVKKEKKTKPNLKSH